MRENPRRSTREVRFASVVAMDPAELDSYCAALGVQPDVTLDALERAYMKRNFALIKQRTDGTNGVNPTVDAERAALRQAYERLAEHLRTVSANGVLATSAKGAALSVPRADLHPPVSTLLTPPVVKPHDSRDDEFALWTFDNWKVNTFAPLVLLALVWAIHVTPAKFLLIGFQVWMHEFGHATAAWMSGRRALPLPFGWTPVEPEFSPFVYFGLLLLFAILFVAGWKERKIWPMVAAVALAGLQFHMTWRMPEHRQEFWWGAFGGVGGEFYLGTLFMLSFWVQLPEKFKWGFCRYVFFCIGAAAFLGIWLRWRDVYRGIEEIPFGTLINGEEDGAGDMNKLMDGYGWKKFDIRRSYYVLGLWCWFALGGAWLAFALRLNRVADWVVGRLSSRVRA